MLTYNDMLEDCRKRVREIMPWDLSELLARGPQPLVLDVREPDEFDAMHIRSSVNVPRGVLEAACEWDYEETVPEVVRARDRKVVVVCRSGRRSLLAADVLQLMGYRDVVSLKTGLRGWNDYEELFVDGRDIEVSEDRADVFFSPKVRPEQTSVQNRV
ncbi:rhodanese-like domain-containing protein [Prosthecochloris sp. HL-130-GSB]|jgi:rhodanese-related sulfurtransferase|uniref:Rhodanese-like domain-containing protein n=1 Tax=Prosthecochloris aestuarii TaxID=1102 RepID=A0A831STR0_PROAE|nr:rhodanese-like domain-containing protein [Prosthecochloris sp. HL-130-GSB]ARM30041.1 sulfurtransferase [Prosthecochloris sp. HL-130-GSB]HED31834.1 rhodanese-like domain-containing protein [Prosthecochloris aestuarii]